MASENICMEIRISNCLPDTSTLIAHRLLTQNTSTTGLALFFQKSAPYASSHLSDSNPILPIFQAQTTNKNCNSYFHSMLNALMKPSDSDDWYRHDNCMFWVSPYYLTISSSTFKMHLESDHFSPPLPQSPWSEPLLSLIWITEFHLNHCIPAPQQWSLFPLFSPLNPTILSTAAMSNQGHFSTQNPAAA